MSPGTEQRETVLRLEGEFDLPAARMLKTLLGGLEAGSKVRIDFGRVRRLHDYGIAVLAQALTRLDGATVKLDGLGTHHVRLLRYFGVDASAFGGAQAAARRSSE
jgi:anti-anti-sigma regulatory factor